MEEILAKVDKLTTRDKLLFTCAVVTLVAALGFGVAGFIVSPTGEVHDSVLWLIAQLLLFTASAFGLGAYTNMSEVRFNRFTKDVRRMVSRGINENNYDDEDTDRPRTRQGD